MSNKLLNKEIEIKEKINKLLSYSPNIEFIRWKNDNWIGSSKTVAVFFCKKHELIFELNCSTIMKSKIRVDGSFKLSCNLCKSETINNDSISRDNLNKVIDEFFKINDHLRLIKLSYNGFTNSLVKFKCIKHNRDITVFFKSIESFVNNFSRFKKKYCCPECIKENVSLRRKLTPEKAQELVNERYKDQNPGFDYSRVFNSFTEYNSKVKLVCPKHGEFEITFQSLIDKRYNTCCPICKLEELSYTKKQAIDKINNIINYKNNILGCNLEFLGFFNNLWVGNTTKLILKCKKHNYVWNTTTFNNFMKKSMIGCHICAAEHRGISLKEEMCYKLISKFINNKDIQRQCRFIVFDKVCNIERTIFVDFYIKSLNLIIEYDGEQHFMFLPYFQLNEDGYKNQVNRDNCLNNYCKENNINLLRIPYVDNNRLEEVIEKYFTTGEDITTKVQPKLLPIKYEEKKLWM